MTDIHTLVLGDYQTNCYFVRSATSSHCVILDPGYAADHILCQLKKLKLIPEAILLTHAHFDHVGALRDLLAELDCPVYLHPADRALPPQLTAGPLPHTLPLADQQVLHLAGFAFTVLHTPGHTPGSVCFRTEDALFSGDTLFAGACGRTDFPGGNTVQMRNSLAKLAGIPWDVSVYPGHGETTTLSFERLHNPYLHF